MKPFTPVHGLLMISTTSALTRSPLRGQVGTVDNPLAADQVLIYGPFEAGFTNAQPGMSCLGTNTVDGGIDTATAELVIRYLCSVRASVPKTASLYGSIWLTALLSCVE